jgi:predicted phosphoribosyltransferase
MKFVRYKSRIEAGKKLAELIKIEDKNTYIQAFENRKDAFCYAIPNGGVPVAEGLCESLNIKYDMLIVRKIKIPWNTEAGFGSVTTNGTVFINESLLRHLNLSQNEINKSIELTKSEIKDRLKFYNKDSNLKKSYDQNIRGKTILMTDDGLASGYTMLAAISMVKKYKPKTVIVTVPTAPFHTVERITKEVDKIICPNIRNVMRFAVADAYQHWYDVSELEVLNFIKKSKYYLSE